MFQCANCKVEGCISGDLEKTMKVCPCKETELQKKAMELFMEEENHKLAYQAALVEAEGYGVQCRMEEIMVFLKKCGYKKLGLIFCMGLKAEAAAVQNILEHHGFEVVSVGCKNGGIPKNYVGIRDEQKISCCEDEIMCNPIGQALMMNDKQVEFNVMMGLCVGHDTLALKYLEKPVTILAVKDRVTGHNPLAPIYLVDSYYHDRFYGSSKSEKA